MSRMLGRNPAYNRYMDLILAVILTKTITPANKYLPRRFAVTREYQAKCRRAISTIRSVECFFPVSLAPEFWLIMDRNSKSRWLLNFGLSSSSSAGPSSGSDSSPCACSFVRTIVGRSRRMEYR